MWQVARLEFDNFLGLKWFVIVAWQCFFETCALAAFVVCCFVHKFWSLLLLNLEELEEKGS